MPSLIFERQPLRTLSQTPAAEGATSVAAVSASVADGSLAWDTAMSRLASGPPVGSAVQVPASQLNVPRPATGSGARLQELIGRIRTLTRDPPRSPGRPRAEDTDNMEF